MLLYIVPVLCSALFFDIGLTQNTYGGAGAYPNRAQPSRSFGPPVPVTRGAEFRAPSNKPYPQPENMTNILIAQIHGTGALGYASFHPMSITDGGVHFKARITGLPGDKYTARIYEYPSPNGAACNLPSHLGRVIHEFKSSPTEFLIIPVDGDIVLTIPELSVTGLKSVLGRTLMLTHTVTGASICSVIIPGDGNKLIFQGKFHSPIAGMVYYMQNEVAAVLGTEWMMFSDGERRDDRFMWKLYKAERTESSHSKVNNELNRCLGFDGIVIADSKQLSLPVSTESPTYRGRMHVPLNTHINPTDTLYLVLLRSDGSPYACTFLNRVDPKVGVSSFAANEVRGEIRFTQDSPFELTRVSIDLTLDTPAFAYGIDVLPSLRRRKQEIRKCPNVKETIYNPFHADPDKVPAQGLGTTDMYAVGDLSGKYGPLENQRLVKLTTWDANLPLFGYYSVIGRAIVIYGPAGPPIACANIDLDGKQLTTVYATFDTPVQGQFIFRQPEGECFADTYLYIEVSKPINLDVEKTFNHGWHVHENKLKIAENHLSTNDCDQSGAHHNPYNVSLPHHNPIYVRDCTIFTPTRCEVGDLASKLGYIDIPKYNVSPGKEPEVAKYYWIDSDLPLCGPTRISDRSLVIHVDNFKKPKLSCANLLVYNPK